MTGRSELPAMSSIGSSDNAVTMNTDLSLFALSGIVSMSHYIEWSLEVTPMRFPSLPVRFLSTGMAFAMIIAMIAVASPTPAFATTGRDAVGMCIDSTAEGSRCEWNVNDKGEIDICNQNACIYCASATAECDPPSEKKSRPTGTLPIGTIITIEGLGTFKVSSRIPTGWIVKAPTKESKK